MSFLERRASIEIWHGKQGWAVKDNRDGSDYHFTTLQEMLDIVTRITNEIVRFDESRQTK